MFADACARLPSIAGRAVLGMQPRKCFYHYMRGVGLAQFMQPPG